MFDLIIQNIRNQTERYHFYQFISHFHTGTTIKFRKMNHLYSLDLKVNLSFPLSFLICCQNNGLNCFSHPGHFNLSLFRLAYSSFFSLKNLRNLFYLVILQFFYSFNWKLFLLFLQ